MSSRKERSQNKYRGRSKKTGLLARRRIDLYRLADGVLGSAFFIVIFALFCSARVGYFLLAALIMMPLVSILAAFVSSRLIYVEISAPFEGSSLEKGDNAIVEITIKNRSILPTPQVRILTKSDPRLEAADKEIAVSIAPRGKHCISLPYTALLAGGVSIGVSDIYVADYFRILKFGLKNLPQNRCFSFGIIPEIKEISAKIPILEETMKSAYGEGNSDDSVEIPSYGASGFPGYEYRKYEPGDPLKRINSKLSAKRGELLVRLDEKPVVSGVLFILDAEAYGGYEYDKRIPMAAQNLLETSLGMGRTLVSRDFGVTFLYESDGEWKSRIVRTERDLLMMRNELSFFRLHLDANGLPSDRIPAKAMIPGGSSVICFTVNPDEELINELNQTSSGKPENIKIYNAMSGEGRSL